ncbi:MAG: BolA/IbaG family iron-sulfur metabolism protein [Pseudomonadales bacterium]|jgi:acid stress-induced BolA-like protein IbaG/YrbA
MQEQIEQHLNAAFPKAQIRVEGAGGKYLLTLIDASFEGKNAVKRQQSVYAGLGDLISSGAVHAVTIVARTPAEAEAQNGLSNG